MFDSRQFYLAAVIRRVAKNSDTIYWISDNHDWAKVSCMYDGDRKCQRMGTCF